MKRLSYATLVAIFCVAPLCNGNTVVFVLAVALGSMVRYSNLKTALARTMITAARVLYASSLRMAAIRYEEQLLRAAMRLERRA